MYWFLPTRRRLSIVLVLGLVSFNTFALESDQYSIKCSHLAEIDENIFSSDNCILEKNLEDDNISADSPPIKKRVVVRFSFGPFISVYGKSDLKYENDQGNITFKKVKWAERNSLNYYNPKNISKTPVRWIDEPTNSFQIEIEIQKQYSFGLKASHAKSVISRLHHDENRAVENVVQAEGTIDGQEVDGFENFYDYFYEIRLSRQFEQIEFTADKIITLVRGNTIDPARKKYSLDYRAGVGIGTFAGYGTVIRNGINYEESEGRWRPIGYAGTINQRLVYTGKKGILSLSLGTNLSTGRLKFHTPDGSISVPTKTRASASLTVGIRIIGSKKNKNVSETARHEIE